MKRSSVFLFLVSFSVLAFSQNSSQQLDSLFRSYYKKDMPGAMVAVQLHGTIVLEKGYGLSDLLHQVPVDRQTRFNIGSITKQFTAYCILQLESEKRLSLNDKLSKYFPGLDSVTGNISIHALLTHSSGLQDHYGFTDTNIVKHATDRDVLDAVMKQHSLLFTSGTQYRYSNTAYCLLGMIIEKISGDTYAGYMQKNVFDPLSMDHSSVFRMGAQIPHRALGYDGETGKAGFRVLDAEQAIFFSTEADGGIYTTIDDYLKWIRALSSGKLNAAIVKKARSAQFPVDAAKKLSYGYGWFVLDGDSIQSVYHTGSNGGFRAIVFTQPSKDNAIVIFSNRDDIDLEVMLERINKILHIDGKSFTKIDALVSFNDCWPNFAPCKKTPSYSASFKKNLNASVTALN